MIIGVVMRMLPSLLKKRVIKKQRRLIYQNSKMPEPFAFIARLYAAHLKNPMLSRTMDITIVDKMVMEAPVTVSKIVNTSVRGTSPINKIEAAAIEVGIDSLIPYGLHRIKITVSANMEIINTVIVLIIGIRHTSHRVPQKRLVRVLFDSG